MAEPVLELSAEQSGSGTPVLAVIPPVAAVVLAVIPPVAAVVLAVIPAVAPVVAAVVTSFVAPAE
jgi:hypothetical protein